MKNLRKIALLALVAVTLSSCGLFRSSTKVKTSESTRTESTLESSGVEKTEILDKTVTVTRENVTGVANSPQTKVTNKGLPLPGEVISKVDSLNLIELKMWFDTTGELITEASKQEEFLFVPNAGIRETITYGDVKTTTESSESLKTSENASTDTDTKDKTKEGQSLLKLLPFFLIVVVAVFLFFWLGRPR